MFYMLHANVTHDAFTNITPLSCRSSQLCLSVYHPTPFFSGTERGRSAYQRPTLWQSATGFLPRQTCCLLRCPTSKSVMILITSPLDSLLSEYLAFCNLLSAFHSSSFCLQNMTLLLWLCVIDRLVCSLSH